MLFEVEFSRVVEIMSENGEGTVFENETADEKGKLKESIFLESYTIEEVIDKTVKKLNFRVAFLYCTGQHLARFSNPVPLLT